MKRLLLVLLAFLFALPALGASTRANRDDSLLFIGWTPVGIHVPTLLTNPFGLGVYLGENFLVGVEYGAFTFEYTDGDDESDGRYTNAGAYVRWFPGTNSFNLGLAVHQRNFSADATSAQFDASANKTYDIDASLDAKATVGSVILGNQWIMDFGLVMALDWVIISGLMSSSVSATLGGTATDASGNVVNVSDLDAETQAEAKRDLEDLGKAVNEVSAWPGLLVFTIGWAF